MASRTTPFLRDVPLATAQSAWRECCAAAGCPARLESVGLPLDRAVGRVTAEPIFGSSALLSVLTAADGYLIVPEDANGLSAGERVDVFPYG